MIVWRRVPGEKLTMEEECLICKSPLEYLESGTSMECAICHREFSSRARCINGHFVCDECHSQGLNALVGICMGETSKDPIMILDKLMDQPFCHMHGPEHHVLVGASLLTAYRNAGGAIDLYSALTEMIGRGKNVPGGVCGYWGACGAGISSGIFISIITKSTPLTNDPFGLANMMTSESLGRIGKVGGPRCCKRNSYLSILAAVDYVKEHFDIEMEKHDFTCPHPSRNNQCIRRRCPFYPD